MPFVSDIRDTQTGILGGINSSLFTPKVEQQDSPGAIDMMAAAARQANVGGALQARLATLNPDLPDAPLNWEPLEHVEGFSDKTELRRLANASTPSELEGMKQRILLERADKELLAKSGWGGTATSLAFGLADPSFLVAAEMPELALARSARLSKILTAVAQGTAGAAGYEAELQLLQDSRSTGESMLNIGAGAILSAALGGLVRTVPKSELDNAHALIQKAMTEPVLSTGGAMASARETTLAEESIAKGGKGLSKAISSTPGLRTDLDIVMNADNVAARTTMQELATVPPMLAKNEAGIATPHAVEDLTDRHMARVADFSDALKDEWKAYTDRVPRGQRLSKDDWMAQIADASRNNDSHAIPEVQKLAQKLRTEIFDPLYEDAKSRGIAVDPVKVAQEAADRAAVDKYVKAQTGQLYTDYRARTNQAILESDSAAIYKGDPTSPTFGGEVRTVAERTAAIKAERDLALSAEQTASDRIHSDIEARVSAAEAAYDRRLLELKKERELNAEAMRKQNELNASAAANTTKTAQETTRALAASALATERRIRGLSIEKADAAHEAARRAYRKELTRVNRDVERGAARREAKLRAKIEFERATTERVRGTAEANAAFQTNRAALIKQYGKDMVRSAAKYARQEPSLRDAYLYGRDTERAKAKLVRELNTAGKARSAETARVRQSVSQLNAKAMAEIEKMTPVKRSQFIKRAQKAMRGTADTSDEVNQLAKLLLEKEGGQLIKRVVKPTINEARAKRIVGSNTYFRRMYDREAIRKNEAEWRKILTAHFSKDGADPSEVLAAVNDVTNKILHNDVGVSNWGTKITVAAAGPLKERVLDVPDELIKKFLVNDPLRVAKSYVRDLAPQVELAKRFGDVDMKQQFQNIADEWAVKKQRVMDSTLSLPEKNKAIAAMSDSERSANEALLRIRDRILGTAGRLAPDSGEGARRVVMASRGFRNLVLSTKLGAVALTGGLMDTARIAASYGFAPTIAKLTKFVASPAYRALSKTQARRVGAAVEVALSRRLNIAADGAITEGWTQKLSEGVFKYSGMSHTTDFNRMLAASLMEDSILKAAQKGGTKFERTRLASLGIGEAELRGIAEQVAAHGGEVDGIRVSGSADWTDKRLADIYDAAILKESRILVQQPGAADRVWWMDKETGKFFGQLKTFAMSSPLRLLTPGLQMLGAGGPEGYARFARFAGFMMIGGYLTHALRQTIAGQKPDTTLTGALGNAFTESGLGGVLPDITDPIFRQAGSTDLGKKIGLNYLTGSAKFADRDVISAYGGPAVGAVTDVWSALWNAQHGGMSAKELHAIRRQLPFQNVWWLRREINALEGETAESLKLKGYDTATFGERLMRTQAMKSQGAAKSAGGVAQ